MNTMNIAASSALPQPTLLKLGARLKAYAPIIIMAAVLAVLMLYPDPAFADAKAKVAENGKKGFDLFLEWAQYAAGAVIIGIGLMTMAGRVELKTFGFAALGCGIVFSAAVIVEYFR
ncbi:hypothetical protein C405_21019 [Stenotrophomonas maltophilia AU12-09]|jgi:type IV secretory pathway VirB2 component (pilin)|nr:hypothetical protein C405_21019 [Stenotrophomonas maltophilia AU12-09]